MAHFNLIFFPTFGNENRNVKAGKMVIELYRHDEPKFVTHPHTNELNSI
jgi:hypothetical protein